MATKNASGNQGQVKDPEHDGRLKGHKGGEAPKAHAEGTHPDEKGGDKHAEDKHAAPKKTAAKKHEEEAAHEEAAKAEHAKKAPAKTAKAAPATPAAPGRATPPAKKAAPVKKAAPAKSAPAPRKAASAGNATGKADKGKLVVREDESPWTAAELKAVRAEIEAAYAMFDVDARVKCIVVTGDGRIFCAGADLDVGFGGGVGGEDAEKVQEHRDG